MKKYLSISALYSFYVCIYGLSTLIQCSELSATRPVTDCNQPITLMSLPMSNSESITDQNSSKSVQAINQVTVVIHGTSQSTNFSWFIPPLFKKLSNSVRTPKGLKHISELNSTHQFVKNMSALCKTDSEHFDIDHVYFFGWSGMLNDKKRREAAQELYDALQSLTKDVRYKKAPITIITHSHGGNVALNVAGLGHHKCDSWCIDRLILLACPIQDVTEPYCDMPFFKNVYHLYSPSDLLQVIDPQGFHHKNPKSLFSRRTIERGVPKIRQAKIKWKKYRGLNHIDFIQETFFKTLPDILAKMDRDQALQNKPDHCYVFSLESAEAYPQKLNLIKKKIS